MSDVIVDTDVASFLFKRDTRARWYRRHLLGNTLYASFMTVAELRRGPLAAPCSWRLRTRRISIASKSNEPALVLG